MRGKITKRSVDALRLAGEAREAVLWDTELKGFGLRVQRGGVKSYILHYRIGSGRGALLRKLTVGKHGSPWTAETARAEVMRLLTLVAQGKDPAPGKYEISTVGQLCDRYLEAARAGTVITRFRRPKRPSTIAIDEGRVSRHIKPLIGKMPVGELRRAHVQRMADAIAQGKTAGTFKARLPTRGTKGASALSFAIDPTVKPRGHAIVTGGPGTAARVVELLGGIYSWAEKRELVPGPNPVRGVETVRGEARDRVLTDDELRTLGNTLAEKEDKLPMPVALNGCKVLLYSGNYSTAHDVDTVVEGLIRHHRDGRGVFGLWLNATGGEAGVPVARSEPVPLEELPGLLVAADVHLIALRPQFCGIVLPSKVYGCIASRRPVVFVGPAGSDVHLLCAGADLPAYERVEPGDAAGFAAALDRLAAVETRASAMEPAS